MIGKDKVRVVSYIDSSLREKLSLLEMETGVNSSQIISVALSSVFNEIEPSFDEI
ncbi:ribbon-helix-helix domain-containing protein, partial [Bacteroides acidifaciens]|nr:ribbon-helix-helix domain-containing protein [Bacteroides acidifaciens]